MICSFLPFLKTNRLGGFIVLVIYMVTAYSVYVPDWSYVYHLDGDIDDGKQFTVLGAYCKDVIPADYFRI